jgi:hypothetical protein
LADVANAELFLPFDNHLPFRIQIIEWKVKKPSKQRKPHSNPKGHHEAPKQPEKKAKEDDSEVTLLSAWLLERMPVVPIVLLSDDDAAAAKDEAKDQDAQ